MGMEESHCACPSSFNVGIRHSLGNGGDRKAGTIKITIALYRGQPYFLVSVRCPDSLQYSWTTVRQDWRICLDRFSCRNSSFFSFIVWHTSSANSSSPTPPPLCPPSPPPSSLIEILPGTQTLPILGTELREGEREGETHKNLYQSSGAPFVVSVPSIHPVSRTKGPGSPIGISRPLLSAKICSNSEEFCWQLSVLCMFGDLLINLCLRRLHWVRNKSDERCILSQWVRGS